MGERGRGRRRVDGDASELRLHANEAGERGGNADRAAAVGADADRRDARGDACRGTGARSARGLRQVPRIEGASGERRIAHCLAAVLAGRRLADDDRARVPQALDRRGVRRRHVVRHAARAEGERRTADGDQVLHRNGHAMQRTERIAMLVPKIGGLRVTTCLRGEHRDERVDLRLCRFQPCKARFQHLHGGDLAGSDQAGDVSGVAVGEVGPAVPRRSLRSSELYRNASGEVFPHAGALPCVFDVSRIPLA